MNLKRAALKTMFSWISPDKAPAAQPAAPAPEEEPRPTATVIPLPSAAPSKGAGLDAPTADEWDLPPPKPNRAKGLMNAPELDAFLGQNHFGFGRHHGSRFRTREALEMGLAAVVSTFQNKANDLLERKQARLDKLNLARLEVSSLSHAMAERLALAGEQIQREMDLLREQISLAERRKGWVLDALNTYQLGFDRGVREALDFELLND